MRNYEKGVGHLYDILKAFDFQYTPLEVLETENVYPDLFYDLSIEAWQRQLVSKQIEDTTK